MSKFKGRFVWHELITTDPAGAKAFYSKVVGWTTEDMPMPGMTYTLGKADGARLNVGFGQGVMLQFVNIKAWLLALTLVAGWIAGQPDALSRFAIVAPVMLVYAFASNFAYALAGALLRHWLAQGARLLWFNRFMALVLVLTAWWMLSV